MPPLAGEGMPTNSNHQQYTSSNQLPIDRVLEAIRSRDGSVKRSGGQWKCTCPAHDDVNPSLSIKQRDDGHVQLNCFAGCTKEQVVASLGMEMK